MNCELILERKESRPSRPVENSKNVDYVILSTAKNLVITTGNFSDFAQLNQPNPTTNPGAKNVNLFFREP